MTRCLIGHTGFVGGNLLRQGRFDALFNSRNIAELAGQSFDEIWCCGVSALVAITTTRSTSANASGNIGS